MPCLLENMRYAPTKISSGDGVITKKMIGPNNGPTFTSNTGYAEFDIPGNLYAESADLTNMYLSFKIATSATAETYLDVAGTLNCINKIEFLTTSGASLFTTEDKDIVDNIKLIENIKTDDLNHSCSVMFGTKANTTTTGVEITSTARTFLLPILNTSLNTVVPMFGLVGLRLRVYWASALDVLVQTTATDLATSSLTYTEVLFHYDSNKISADAMIDLQTNTGGRYVISGSEYAVQPDVMTAKSKNISLGFGKRKIKKIYACFRTSAAIAAVANSSHSFTSGTLTKAELKYNGILVNGASWEFGEENNATMAAEMMKSNKYTFMNPGGNTSIESYSQDTTGVSVAGAVVGQFIIAFDLTSGLDTCMSPSGMDVATGTLQLLLTATGTPAYTVNVVCEYQSSIVLDMKGSQSFVQLS